MSFQGEPLARGRVFCLWPALEPPLESSELFELDHWDRVSLSGEGALSRCLGRMFVEA